ncbi:MAG: SDR family NAD(P)-dependent oxidoreductase [Candidatus Hodarchaeales archaeon]|jgi:NAD(P)-dependent dehydrogenase (short-subunit alcohol dehydrogenase family)
MGLYKDLENKRVVITGGASGIGLATTERFISEGSDVVILDWNQGELNKTLIKFPKLKGGIFCDVSNQEAIKNAFKEIDNIIGGIDILISNAGISVRKPFLDIEYKQWSKVLRINLDGMFLTAKEAVNRMNKEKSGVILFTASTNGLVMTKGHPLYSDYNASKAGVIALAKTIALEFAPWLRANAICPGYVLTPMQKAEYTPKMLEEVNSQIPLKRHAKPEEIAALFAFLASSEASYITGQSIAIDGGETA